MTSPYENSQMGNVSVYPQIDNVTNTTTLTVEWTSLKDSVVYLVTAHTDYKAITTHFVNSKDPSGTDQDNVTPYSYDFVFDTSDPVVLGLRSVIVSAYDSSENQPFSRFVQHQ